MIRVNLLEQKKDVAASGGGGGFSASRLNPLALVWVIPLVLAIGYIGWSWWSLSSEIDDYQQKIERADTELKQLEKALKTVDERQKKKAALEQRVTLIADLKRRQRVPVHLVDQISYELPEFLWLEQLEERSGDVKVRGKATTFNAVSNFYNNLKDSPFFINVVMGATKKVPEGVSFSLSTRFQPPQPQEAPQAQAKRPGKPKRG
jgi:type IV pilus assembly protein PilN